MRGLRSGRRGSVGETGFPPRDGAAGRDAGRGGRVRRFAAVLLALAICAGAATAYVRGRPDPQVQAQADGCPRNLTALYQRQAPTWVYVGDAGTDAAAPAPPPRWLGGVAAASHLPYL